MKKTLFSLAFIAASGVYVAAANHLFQTPATDGSAALAEQTAAPADISSVEPAASPRSPLGEAAPIVAEVAPASAPTPSEPRSTVGAPIVAEVAPSPMPPLPRPRPTPPSAAIHQAASTDVAASSAGGYRDGIYTGSSENAYYGRVQVRVTVANHQVASVKVLSYPNDRRTSRYINSQALPLLQREVIAADSASVDTVSGATLTSEAYIRSLGNALQQAGAAGA